MLVLEGKNPAAEPVELIAEPVHLLLEELQRVGGPPGAHPDVLLQDQRGDLVGHLRRHVGIGRIEGHVDGRGALDGPAVAQGKLVPEDGAALHVVDDVVGRDPGLVGIDPEAFRQIEQVGPRHQLLLDDLHLLDGADRNRGLRELPGDLRRLDQQRRARLVDRRQDRGDGQSDRRDEGRDHQEIGKPPPEDRQVVLEVDRIHNRLSLPFPRLRPPPRSRRASAGRSPPAR